MEVPSSLFKRQRWQPDHSNIPVGKPPFHFSNDLCPALSLVGVRPGLLGKPRIDSLVMPVSAAVAPLAPIRGASERGLSG